VRDPEHTAIVNAISTLISVVQVGMIGLAVWLLRFRGGTAVLVETEGLEAGARH
jgi:hypothetical protein